MQPCGIGMYRVTCTLMANRAVLAVLDRPPMAEPGTLGTIIRPDGSAYVTYDRHPLCTYLGDTAPDQANGNSLNQNGGLWHEVTSFG